MGEKLMAGRGVPQNNSEAMQWFRWNLHFWIKFSLLKTFFGIAFICYFSWPTIKDIPTQMPFCLICSSGHFFGTVFLMFDPVWLQSLHTIETFSKISISSGLILLFFLGRLQTKAILTLSTILLLLISTATMLAWMKYFLLLKTLKSLWCENKKRKFENNK